MSGGRAAELIVYVVNLIGRLLLALLIAVVLWYGLYLLANTECEEPDCSWLADVFDGGRSVYMLVVCVLVAVGLVWGIPAARRRRTAGR